METKWEAKKGVGIEIKRHITYFREQIELRVAPKKEVGKPGVGPNTSWWPLLGATKLAPKKLKTTFFQYIWYSLKAHAHYFTVFIYLKTWRGTKLGIFTHFTFTNVPWCSQSMNSLIYVYSIQIPSWSLTWSHFDEPTDICILCTDPQLITDVIKLRTTATQKSFLYYPLMGLRFWPWNFHQQGQGFHSKEVREFVRGSGKVRKIWYFF